MIARLADVVEGVAEPDGSGGLAFARRSRRHRGDEDQLAVVVALELLDVAKRDLGLVTAVGLRNSSAIPEPLAGELSDRLHAGLLGDIDIAGDAC